MTLAEFMLAAGLVAGTLLGWILGFTERSGRDRRRARLAQETAEFYRRAIARHRVEMDDAALWSVLEDEA